MEKSEVRQKKSFVLEHFQLVCALCVVQLLHCIPQFVHIYYSNWIFMADQVQIWFLLPIRGLPYTGLHKEVTVILSNTSYKQEQTSLLKINLG